jgi:hypothetical protein
MLMIYVFQVAVIPAQCVGPALLPMVACVPEVAEVALHSAAPTPACSVALEQTDSVDLDPSTTTAALCAIIVQVVGKHWPTAVISTAAAQLDAHHF